MVARSRSCCAYLDCILFHVKQFAVRAGIKRRTVGITLPYRNAWAWRGKSLQSASRRDRQSKAPLKNKRLASSVAFHERLSSTIDMARAPQAEQNVISD